MNHLRPDNVCVDPILRDVLLAQYKRCPNWVEQVPMEDDGYQVKFNGPVHPLIRTYAQNAAEIMSMHCMSVWLGMGPKIFRPTPQQRDALANVELKIEVKDFQSPYPAMLVETDVPPFYATLLHAHGPYMTFNLFTKGNVDDTVTCVFDKGQDIEESILLYDAECAKFSRQAAMCCRVAANSCMALTHYGNRMSYMFPQEAQDDKYLARHAKKEETQERARKRVEIAPQLVSFTQDIKLHREEMHVSTGPHEETGRSVRTHWRKGHWKRQNWGKDLMQTKVIFIKPVMVRADLFTGDASQTTTIYRG